MRAHEARPGPSDEICREDNVLTRPTLPQIDQSEFDVIVIGGGINGASAVQHLAAEGYSALLVEANDYGSGASSRSSRLMHYGLRYLDRGEPLLNYVMNPLWFLKQCKRARKTMRHRADLVRTMPERMKAYKMLIPVYRDDYAAPWQLKVGLSLINVISRTDCPVKWRQLSAAEVSHTPFVREARDIDNLKAVFEVEEFYFDWPERLVADYVFDAMRMGAVCRNYTHVDKLLREDGKWRVELTDPHSSENAVVRGTYVVNATGPWIDDLLGESLPKPVPRQVAATKGTHAFIRLPEEYQGICFAHFNSNSYPFYVSPWRDLHYIGPTETHWEGDPSNVRATDWDANFLVNETNRMLPGLNLMQKDILFFWSGVRPMPHIPGYDGKQNLIPEFNTHEDAGFPNILSIPGGPLMVHRFTGQEAASVVKRSINPSRARQIPGYISRRFGGTPNSPPVHDKYSDIRLSNLVEIAVQEHVEKLQDIVLRRSGLVWTDDAAMNEIDAIAEIVAPALGWSDERKKSEIEATRAFITDNFLTFHPEQENTPRCAAG